jgi:hypothetical protein
MLSKRRRASVMANLSRRSKGTSTLVFVSILLIAIALDLLGLLKEPISAIPAVGAVLSFVLNWVILVPGVFLLVTVPTYIAQLRIRRINKATKATKEATAAFASEAEALYRRLQPEMKRVGRAGLAVSLNPHGGEGIRKHLSYGRHLLMGQAWVLILESIPVISAGPWVVIKVARVMSQQRKEYHLAGMALAELRSAERKIVALERFELAVLSSDVEAAVALLIAQMAASRQQRAISAVPQEPVTMADLRPAYSGP